MRLVARFSCAKHSGERLLQFMLHLKCVGSEVLKEWCGDNGWAGSHSISYLGSFS